MTAQQLDEHFNKMQDMASRYLQHLDPYVDRNGERSGGLSQFPVSRDDLFIGDMLYMLDGPEQRTAQA